jgi:HTH-type transcriptional regulator / antitoxin HigA
MKLKPVKTESEYRELMDWVDLKLGNPPDLETAEGEALQIALLLIKDYEDKNYPIPLPDPIAVIKLKMQESGLKNKDLVALKFGSKGHISSLLSKRKPLTLDLAKRFHQEFGIPAEVFLG